MKIVEQLMEAMRVAQEAQAKVNEIVAEIEAKVDGRRRPPNSAKDEARRKRERNNLKRFNRGRKRRRQELKQAKRAKTPVEEPRPESVHPKEDTWTP